MATLIASSKAVNQQDVLAKTALMWAVLGGEPKCVSLLIDAGTDVNIQDKEGFTALMFAVGSAWDATLPSKGSPTTEAMTTTFKLVLESGVDVDARDAKGRTALFSAVNGESLAPSGQSYC